MSVRARRTVTLLVPLDIYGDTLESFYEELRGRLKEQPEEIRLDCSLLEHATSAHINTLWHAQGKCEDAGVSAKLISVTYGLERVLAVLDLRDLFVVERDEVEARAGKYRPVRGEEAPDALSLAVAPTVEGISQGMQRLHDYLLGLNHGEMFAFDLETVFYEVTTNIRLHGDLPEGEYISFTAAASNGSVHLCFEDQGAYFDPTSRRIDFDPQRAINQRQTRGFGLAIIRKLVDGISYERQNDSVNILNLEKKINRNGGQF